MALRIHHCSTNLPVDRTHSGVRGTIENPLDCPWRVKPTYTRLAEGFTIAWLGETYSMVLHRSCLAEMMTRGSPSVTDRKGRGPARD